ncbi:MAG: SCO family protein [Meiothermus sp.]|nr:SCO family protein [Meiothermus sp.]
MEPTPLPNPPKPDLENADVRHLRLLRTIRRITWAALVVVILIGAAGLFVLPNLRPYGPYGTRLVSERPAYDFSLVGNDNKPYKLSDFRGKAVYIFFGFVNCPDVCPTTLSELKKVYQALNPAEQSKVQVLLITADPERDTPEVLEKYVRFFHPKFLGLTGTSEQIAETAKGFGVFYIKSNIKSATEYNVDHTATTFLIDPSGKLRLLYGNGKPAQIGRMLEDLRWVLGR